MYPFRTRNAPSVLPGQTNVPANAPKADARTRTGDPFITREVQEGEARVIASSYGRLFSAEQAKSAAARVPADGRAGTRLCTPLVPSAGL